MGAALPCGRPRPAHTSDAAAAPGADWRKRLDQHVEGTGLKKSAPRERIIETIVALGASHFHAQDLVKKVRRSHPSIGPATVYRTLTLLKEAGIIRESLTDEQGQALYEIASENEEHHDHIVCLDCREVFEFHDEMIEKRQHGVAEKMSFREAGHKHVIYANCSYLKR